MAQLVRSKPLPVNLTENEKLMRAYQQALYDKMQLEQQKRSHQVKVEYYSAGQLYRP